MADSIAHIGQSKPRSSISFLKARAPAMVMNANLGVGVMAASLGRSFGRPWVKSGIG
jgi:hypothetical protein